MGLSWISVGGSASHETQDQNKDETVYGDRTPILSDDWKNAFSGYKAPLNTSGANANQQTGIDLLRSTIDNGRTRKALGDANYTLGNIGAGYGSYANKSSYTLGDLSRRAANGEEGYESYAAPKDVKSMMLTADKTDARTGASLMQPYSEIYDKSLINPSLADYDADTAKQRTAFRAGSAGAFGNKRTGVAESNFADAATRGRGTFESNLLSDRFKTAAELGEQDATRYLASDTGNADRNLLAGKYNQDSDLSAQTFNNTLTNQRQQFDVDAAYKGDQQRMQALAAEAGITQQVFDNVVKADGVDVDQAQALFAAGTITQSQLETILNMAGSTNGSSFNQNSSSKANSTTNKVEVHAEGGFS